MVYKVILATGTSCSPFLVEGYKKFIEGNVECHYEIYLFTFSSWPQSCTQHCNFNVISTSCNCSFL